MFFNYYLYYPKIFYKFLSQKDNNKTIIMKIITIW